MPEDPSITFLYLGWACALGALSAVSLPLGSLVGICTQPPKSVVGFLAAFGAGALLAALSIELVAPTVQAVVESNGSPHSDGHAALNLLALIAGSLIGGLLFVTLDQILNTHGGFLRKTATTVAYFATREKYRKARIVQDLSKVDALRRVPSELIQRLVNFVKPLSFGAGQVLFRQGDQGDQMYFIRRGSVSLSRGGQTFKKLGPGDVLGEISLLTGGSRTASATCLEELRALSLSKRDLDRLRELSPELDADLRQLATGRLGELRSRDANHMQEILDWTDEAIEAVQQGTRLPTSSELQQARAEHTGAPLAIWLGILLDGIPESFVIGAGFAGLLTQRLLMSTNAEVPFTEVIPYTLIAGLFLSNFPEALSSSVGMRSQGWSVRRVLFMWSTLMIITAAGAGLGYWVGETLSHTWLITVEGIAAGAMLTMIAATMVPDAVHLGGPNLVGLSTLVGFLSAICFKLLE